MKPLKLALLLLSSLASACGSTAGPAGGTLAGGPVGPGGPAAGPGAAAAGQPTPAGHPASGLVSRDVLFGNPERNNVQISPDGKTLSWLAPQDGVMNLWVAPVGKLDQARAITADKTRPVRVYQWAFNNKNVLYQQDSGGDENWHIFSVEVKDGKTTDLTPFDKVAARIEAVSHRQPNKVLLGINNRDPQLHDVYEVQLGTGKRRLVLQNPGYVGFQFDDDLEPRLAYQMSPEGGTVIKKANKDKMPPAAKAAAEPTSAKKGDGPGAARAEVALWNGVWEDFLTIPQEDSLTTQPLGFDRSGRYLYMWDSRGRDTGALVVASMKLGQGKVVAEDPRADGSDILVHPTTNTIQAVSFTYDRDEWKVLDKKVQRDFDKLKALANGEFTITSRSLDDRSWIVAAYSDHGPARFYLWDRARQKETFLFTNRPALEKLELAPMQSVVIPARDGLSLVSYLTLPAGSDANGDGVPEKPQPMVLVVHGGPWARDHWGMNPIHQLLANRGYAALSVNYRGSTGFGKKFINAANREWAGKMHDDLLDAVDWAVKRGVADGRRVCIMGGSYGGYATLVGLTFTPDVFACGVDIVGPSNLRTLLATIPPYWVPMIKQFTTRVGDPTTDEGKKLLESRSPLFKAGQISKPLLIGQGANDPRVKQAEADQIVKALEDKQIPVTYVLFPDEGHGFARPENSLAFWAVTEAFLSAHLGGTFQPLDATTFQASSITVPVGAAGVPQLSSALPKR